MKSLDTFYFQQPEPIKGTLLALRQIVLSQDPDITHELKYGMPFFSFKGKMFCYLWIHKKIKLPYLGIVEGKHFNQAFLIQEKRSRMKIMLIDPSKDLPIARVKTIVKQAIGLYKSGVIKTKHQASSATVGFGK